MVTSVQLRGVRVYIRDIAPPAKGTELVRQRLCASWCARATLFHCTAYPLVCLALQPSV